MSEEGFDTRTKRDESNIRAIKYGETVLRTVAKYGGTPGFITSSDEAMGIQNNSQKILTLPIIPIYWTGLDMIGDELIGYLYPYTTRDSFDIHFVERLNRLTTNTGDVAVSVGVIRHKFEGMDDINSRITLTDGQINSWIHRINSRLIREVMVHFGYPDYEPAPVTDDECEEIKKFLIISHFIFVLNDPLWTENAIPEFVNTKRVEKILNVICGTMWGDLSFSYQV